MQESFVLDNPQAVTFQEAFDLGWLVAAIEGEGSISIPGFRRRGIDADRRNVCKIGIKPVITLSNTNEIFIDHARNIASRYTSPGYKQSLKSRRSTWAASYRNVWEGCKRVKALLDVIEPYLVTKRPQASMTREFCESRLSVAANAPYTKRELWLFSQCRLLHNHGARDQELHDIVTERLRDFKPDVIGRPKDSNGRYVPLAKIKSDL